MRMQEVLVFVPVVMSVFGCGRTVVTSCGATATPIGDDELTAVGWSVNDMFATLGAAVQAPATLFDSSEATVTVVVSRGSGSAEFVESHPVTEEVPNGELFGLTDPSINVICDNVVRVPAAVHVTSSDFTIDAQFNAVADGTGERVTTTTELPPVELDGVPSTEFADGADAAYLHATHVPDRLDFGSFGYSGTDSNEDGSVTGWSRPIVSWEVGE